MLSMRSRVLLRFAAAGILMLAAANSASSGMLIAGPLDLHRDAVDELSYPWSSIGKLFNETGSSCSGVVIARDKILTAAHCLYNARTRRFIPAEALHFLVGYRTGRYSAHARIASYEIGAGFDPLRYEPDLRGRLGGADRHAKTCRQTSNRCGFAATLRRAAPRPCWWAIRRSAPLP